MALYIPAGQRRRRLIVVGVVAAVLGLALGAFLGRSTAPTPSDLVGEVRADARALDARLQALPLEYEQSLSGAEGFTTGGGPADSLLVISSDAAALARRAEWLNESQRAEVVTAIDQAQQLAAAEGSAAEFETAITEAAAAVDQTFGLPSP